MYCLFELFYVLSCADNVSYYVLFVLFYVLCVCVCVNVYYCHRVTTQSQLHVRVDIH
jgi:hypothetical protein